jgi:hypothetical protein
MECVSIALKASMMDVVFVKSAVGAVGELIATFAMEQYFITASASGIERSTRKLKQGIFSRIGFIFVNQ